MAECAKIPQSKIHFHGLDGVAHALNSSNRKPEAGFFSVS